jgi:fatty-acyl-CoA synthase
MFGFGKNKGEPAKAGAATTPAAAAPAASIPRGLMVGRMQDWQLTVDKVLDHAKANHAHREIVTRSVEGPIVRETYGDLYARARQVSAALLEDGVVPGDRIATLAWNSGNHMETWFGTMGIGSVLHTVNPRLFPEQIAWILNHAEDTHLFFDLTFIPIVQKIHSICPMVRRYVLLTDEGHMPRDTGIPNLVSYERFIAGKTQDVTWGGFDENTAAGLCYTSGTTGNPKGVLYSHRSNVLHTMFSLQKDCMGLGVEDTILPIVPLFHANAWGITFSAPAVGAKLVMPGAKMDGESVFQLLDSEKVTFSAAVPTVWLMLKQYLEETGNTLPHLKRVVIGGSAVPEAILKTFEDKYEVQVFHAWGMTEMSPMGSMGSTVPEFMARGTDAVQKNKLKQGRAPFGVEYKITDDDGKELPRDGKSAGHLLVRGPAVAGSYFKGDGGQILDKDGWFDTGDVANLCELGYMQITDRAKDVIKSGGEWISSIDIENFAVGHPAVANAAAIGLPHPKWDERPLLIIELKPGASASREEILNYLNGKIAKWWMPDDVQFIDKIPLGATGKINKLSLRQTFKEHKLPTIQAAE